MPGNQICTQPHYRKNVTSWNPSQKMLPLGFVKEKQKIFIFSAILSAVNQFSDWIRDMEHSKSR